MAKYKKEYKSWVDTLTIKQLKTEAVQRGLDFEKVSSLSVLQLQSWVRDHKDSVVNKALLVSYDRFIRGIGDLDFNHLGFDMEAHEKPLPELTHTYREHDPDYVPRAGTKKELTQELVNRGLPTKEIINEVYKQFGRTNPQSIKSWCSRFRRQMKVKTKQDEQND